MSLTLEKSKAQSLTAVADYATSIKKYESSIDQMEADKSYESTINLEMTQNMSGNLVTPEEYTPSGKGNIDIETQKNADNNTLDSAEVNPSGNSDLTNQTLYNLDQNKVNVQELNAPQGAGNPQEFDDMPGNLGFDVQQNQPAGRIEQ